MGSISSYTTDDVHIFLPAAGNRYDATIDNINYFGLYWNSTFFNGNDISPEDAWTIQMSSSSVNAQGGKLRRSGFSIRPVRSK